MLFLKSCVCTLFLEVDIFYLINCAVAFVYLVTGDSDYRVIRCPDIKKHVGR